MVIFIFLHAFDVYILLDCRCYKAQVTSICMIHFLEINLFHTFLDYQLSEISLNFLLTLLIGCAFYSFEFWILNFMPE